MSDQTDAGADADARLRELDKARIAQIDRCHYRTATRVAAELKRVARAEGDIGYYVTALHTLMNYAEDLLDPEPGREAAVEMIAVLESEDLARQIEPALSPGYYEYLVSRLLSCAYDGFGRTTGTALGYNSEGVHETVAEGVQVCRRTGKLECINCFRNYATDVLRAADDLDMALHHARQVIATGNTTPGSDQDRRWAGANDEVRLLLLSGQPAAASEALDRAETFVATYHNPTSARLKVDHLRETLAILATSTPTTAEATTGSQPADGRPPDDEYPRDHLNRELNSALRAALQGDPTAAIATLTPWDRLLTERHALDIWFEVRLRLVAATRVAGDERRAALLARPLDEKARAARDWLTLRRLTRLLDPSIPAHPLAPAGPIVSGGDALASTPEPSAPIAETTPTDPPVPLGDATEAEPESTPLQADFRALGNQLQVDDEEVDPRPAALAKLLQIEPDRATHPVDAARLLHLARAIATDPTDGPAVWLWAEAIAAHHPRVAAVLSLLATLGDALRQTEGSSMTERISPERLERLVRESLDLDPNDPSNFARAAAIHGGAGRIHEAERCLARLVRLDRANDWGALRLADIYAESDRAADAVAVLDMALRAGADDPEIAWRAGGLAHGLGQYAAALTYLDRLEELEPGRPWAHYYRASGLLRLDRPAEALESLDEEERRQTSGTFHVLVLRAAAQAALGDLAATRSALEVVLAADWGGVDYLTHAGLVALAERLWEAAATLLDDDPDRLAVADRLLATGLAPNPMFAAARRAMGPPVADLNFYVCAVIQPLGPSWAESPGCLAHEQSWTAYQNTWGVAALDEAEAGRLALAEQARCAPDRATLDDVTLQGQGYTDHPGVVWQGIREPVE